MALDFGFKATVTITGSFTIVVQDWWLENIVKYAILYSVCTGTVYCLNCVQGYQER